MLTLTIDGKVAHIAIDDGKANAVGFNFLEAVNGALDEIDANAEVGAIVLSGREGMFSAGFDLKVMTTDPERAGEMVNGGGRLLNRLFTHKLPIVAAATGHAMAAGAFLLLASDTRFGADGAFRIGLNETAIGMALPVFGIELAKARLAKTKWTEAFIQAKLYGPEDAIGVGFLDHVLPADQVVQAALDHAAQLAELPQFAYHANKMALRGSYAEVIAESLA